VLIKNADRLWFDEKLRDEVNHRMRDTFIQRRKSPIMRPGEVGEVNVSNFARGLNGRAIQCAAVARDEERRFFTEKFGENIAGVLHRRA